MKNTANEPIAIVGIGCRFPGANSLNEYWDLLVQAKDAITEIPPDRWDANAYYHPDYNVKGKINVKWGGYLTDVDKFDAAFFSVPPMEALRMDPQQRMLLECTYQAMEDAGIDIESLAGENVGVFVGISAHDYGDICMTPTEHVYLDGKTISGGSVSIAANRISYTFDFRGPSFAVDTACSSSLIAMHNACRSIWNDECPMAVVGGVNSLIKPEITMSFSKGGFLSPTGRCHTFDIEADGYIRSEGIGVIILKPLSKAIEDGDKIYTTIIGTAINEDGATDGISMPSQDAQIAVFREAYKRAGINPADVQYVEAHGTGTAVGDPIEATSLGIVIGSGKKDGEKLYIGSVKSNIGHCEPASGMAGTIKLAMSMKNKQIPQNIHFHNPNPKIPFKKYNLEVPTKLMNWPDTKGKPMYAGINSFGFGGANAHVVLQGYEDNRPKIKSSKSDRPQLFMLSGKNPNALKDFAKSFVEYLLRNEDDPNITLEDICYTANARRTHHNLRLALVVHNKRELYEQLNAYIAGETRPGMSSGRSNVFEEKPKVAFICSGQGPQWWGMARQLFEKEPVFRKVIEDADKIVKTLDTWSIIEEMMKDEKTSRIGETNIAQPALFAVQVGLAKMWESMGIKPDGVVGHSIGEVAAGYISGMFTFEEAVKVIYYRSKVQHQASGKGKMLAVGLEEKEAAKLIIGHEDTVSVGTINGPTLVTLSGNEEVLKKIAAELDKKDIFHRFLDVNVPFHSPYMDPIKDDLLKALKDLHINETKIPLYSTVTGKLANMKFDNNYWFRNVRETVRFTDATQSMINDGFTVFVELSPHPILSRYITELLEKASKKGLVVGSIRKGEEDMLNLLGSLGNMYTYGYPANWKEIFKGTGNRIDLPTYPFQRESFWIETEEGKQIRLGKKIHPLIKKHTESARFSNDHIWDINLDKRLLPWIDDHRVQGPIIFPGAGHCELAISCAKNAFGDDFCFLEDIYFKKALFLPDEGDTPEIQLNVSADDGSFNIFTRKKGDAWTRHSYGKIKHHKEKFEHEELKLQDLKKRCTQKVEVKPLYDELFECGLKLGPVFRGITNLWRNPDPKENLGESVGEINVPEGIRHGVEEYNIHPAILDACFQTLFGAAERIPGEKMGVMVPVHIHRLKFYRKPTVKLYSYGKIMQKDNMFVTGKIWIFDEEGNLCTEIQGFKCRYIEGTRGENDASIDKTIYKWEWKINERLRNRLARKPKDYIPSPLKVKEYADKFIAEVRNREEKRIFDNEFAQLLDRLTASYIEVGYKKLGFEFKIGTEFTTQSFIDKYKIIPLHHKLLGRCMEILMECGILEKTSNGWKVVKKPDFEDSTKTYNRYLHEYPYFEHELIMLNRCAPYLDEIFTGKSDAVQLLFPEEEWDAIVRFYLESYSFKKYNEIIQHTLKEMLKNLPKDQTLRILEIGAGTGGVTSAVLPILPADRTEYVYTDVSYMFMAKAQDRFSDYPFLEFKTLDISKELETQGFDLHSYDMVIASDVLHATASIRHNLNNVHKLLAPQGVLVMLEVTQCPWYTDLIFGLTEGWWMFNDYELRPKHPTMSLDTWLNIFKELGFTDTLPLTEADKPGVSAQTVFITRNKDFTVTPKPIVLPEKLQKGGKWLIFRDTKGVADFIAESIQKLGESYYLVESGKSYSANGNKITINAGNQDDMKKLFDIIEADNKPFNGIIHCWNINHPSIDKMTNETLEESYLTGCTSVLNMLRELYRKDDPNPNIHFWIVTNNATNAGNYSTLSLSQTSVWGLARTLMHENQGLGTTLIDLSEHITNEDKQSLFEEICQEEHAEEVAIRGKIRFLHKFSRVSKEEEERSSLRKANTKEYPFHLVTKETGIIDNLMLQETYRKELKDDEIEIQPVAVGMNFKDVMIATGSLHEDAPKGGYTGTQFGMECAGIVSAVGKGVKEFKVGDEVMGVSPDSFASLVVTKADFMVKKPKKLSFEEAATIPFAYLTAYYSLNYCARMRKGDKVLIHSASGGVGVAAIRLAQQVGAEVYATVGNSDKKDFVRRLGVKHIMDSRSLDFADEIMKATNGQGVDIVLNSLSGTAIYKSLSVLGKYGRFVEIGKTDIYENNPLSLRPFGNNLSYFAVDIDKLLTECPDLCGQLIREFMELFKDNGGTPPAHPYHSFPMSRITDAFNFMATARHIGKVVTTIDYENIRVAPSEDIRTLLKSDATYLITGGFSGLGLAVAEWMVDNGVKHLVLMSRSGAKDDTSKNAIAKMREKGAKILEAKTDVGNETEVKKIFDEMRRTMPQIRGIIHSAMVLDDAILPDMTHERFMKAIRPKVMGAWNLHNLTLNDPIDFFVSFSSVSGQYGTPAQSNYAAANLFLDMLSHYRQSLGLSGSTISWGVIAEVGFVARNKSVSDILESQGWRAFTPKKATSVLGRIMLQQPEHRAAMDVDWPAIAKYYPKDNKSHRFGHLLVESEDSKKAGGTSLKETLLEIEPEKRQEMLQHQLAERVARILGTSAGKIDMEEPISNMGLDSLMANQLRNWIHLKLDVDFSMMKIMRGPSIIELTKQLLDEIGTGPTKDQKTEEKSELDKWFVRPKKNPNAKYRLFCLPYMGGGASAFLNWADSTPSDIEVVAIQYPGREDRQHETPYEDVEKLVKDLAEAIQPLLDKPFAFYGHSVGAGTAFKLAHYLNRKYTKLPKALFVGGWIAPHLKSPFKIIENLSEEAIKDDSGKPQIYQHLRNLEMGEDILSNQKLMDEMMPSIKADIILGKKYKYTETEPLTCPIIAFAGEKDTVFTIEQVKAWEKQTNNKFEFKVVKGGHIFLRESKDVLLKNIVDNLLNK